MACPSSSSAEKKRTSLGDFPLLYQTVRSFNKAVLVDTGIGGKRGDQADVRTFRGFNRANPAVVSRMYVSHLETGPFAGQTAWSKSRKTTFVGNLRERV